MYVSTTHTPEMTRRIIALLTVFALVLIAGRVVATEHLEPIHSVEGVSEYHLDNGLKILLIPDLSAATLTINVIIRAGSRHEMYGETGVAHLLEHLQFKGTPRYPSFSATINKYGWSPTASTWYDHTNYLTVMEGTDENLEQVIKFEADRLTNSLLLPIHLEQEMPIVRNELENSRNSPWGFLPPRLRAVSLEWHNYGKATIGNRADIEQMPIERIRAFYRKYYQPDNVTLLLAGRFDDQRALAEIQKYWGSIPKPNRQLPPQITREPASDGERMVTIRRVGGVPMAGVHYHIPSGPHEDFAAVHVLAHILMASRPGELWQYRQARSPGRLHQSLVQEGRATSTHGSISGLSQLGFLEFYAFCEAEEDIRPTLHRLIDTVESSHPAFTDRDVRNARNSLIRATEETVIELPRLARELTYREANGDWRLFYLQRDRLRSVTRRDIARVAAKYLCRSNRTAGIYIPEATRTRVEIPSPPNVSAVLDDYKSHEPIVRGEFIEPDPLVIESRIIRRTLPVGTHLVLLPKGTRGDRIRFSLTLRYGSVESLRSRRAASEMLAGLIAGSEARRKAREGIKGTFGSFSLNATGMPGSLTFTGRCEQKYLARVMTMFKNLLRAPTISPRTFQELKQKRRLSLQAALTSVFECADRAARRAGQPYEPQDPRYIPTHEEELEQLQNLKIGDVRRVWDDLMGASHGTFIAVGTFDTEEMMNHVERITDEWNPPQPVIPLRKMIPDNPVAVPITVALAEKESAAFAGDLWIDINQDHQDYTALLVAQEILKVSRLIPRINQEDGLSYLPRVDFKTAPDSEGSQFTIRLTCNVHRLRDLENAVREVFASIHDDPFTLAEWETSRLRLGHLARIRMSSDSNIARTLATLANQSRTFHSYVAQEKRIEALSLEEVQRVAERYLDYSKMMVAIAGERVVP